MNSDKPSDPKGRWWRLSTILIAAVAIAPIVTVLLSWLLPFSEHWDHFGQTILPKLVVNSLGLLCLVAIGTCVIGLSLGWIISQFDFPGRRFFQFALLFPLAIPAYVIGFVYLGLTAFSGPLFTGLRSIGVGFFFDMKTIYGAAFVLVLSLYPYVYLLTKQGFATIGHRYFEAARALGVSSSQVFFKVALPMNRPWLFVALSLVGMETLADFGAVSIFVVDTFSVGIYKAWNGFFSPPLAAQLASILVVIVGGIVIFDKVQRGKRSFVSLTGLSGRRRRLHGRKAIICFGYCCTLFLLSFVIPMLQLLVWALQLDAEIWESMLELTSNSVLIGLMVSLLVTGLCLLLVYTYRFYSRPFIWMASQAATLGYALPGSVLAIGLFLPLAAMDHRLADFIMNLTGTDPGLLLTGTVFAVVIGLSIRFMAVGHAQLHAAQQRVSKRIDEAAQNFGSTGIDQMKRIHIPIAWKAVAASISLVFVDSIKEMPLTLMTRPFSWDTLSVKIFELISEGEWEMAAAPAVILSIVGLTSLVLLGKEAK